MKKGYASQGIGGVSVFTTAGSLPMGNARNAKNRERLARAKQRKTSKVRVPGAGFGTDYVTPGDAKAYNYIPSGSGTPVAGRGKPFGKGATEERMMYGPSFRSGRGRNPINDIDASGSYEYPNSPFQETKASKRVRGLKSQHISKYGGAA